MLKGGFIKIYRSLLDWEWYDDPVTLKVFLHLLLTVNIEDKKWHNLTIKRGSRVCSIAKLSQEMHLSIQQTKTALAHLQNTNELTKVSTPQYTLFTIKNYGRFQNLTNQLTNKTKTTNLQNENDQPQYKKEKRKKNNIYNNNYNICSNKDIASASLPTSEPCDDWLTKEMTEDEFEKLTVEQKRKRIAYFRENG